MANGRKNYFRHSFHAFEDEKIQLAIEKLGYEGYAYYFILLELLAKNCENSFKNPITIHQQSLKIVWRKQTQSCKKVITKLQESGLFVATFKGNFIEFDIPKLEKYLGKYENKLPSNMPNKRKEKEIKEKEIKINEIKEENIPKEKNQTILEFEKFTDLLNGVSEKLQKKWLTLYALDHILEEFEKAETWLMANSGKKKNVGLFLTNWLSRSNQKESPKTFAQIRQDNILKMVNPYE